MEGHITAGVEYSFLWGMVVGAACSIAARSDVVAVPARIQASPYLSHLWARYGGCWTA